MTVSVLGASLPAHLRSRWNGSKGRITILNLHRTCADDGSAYQPLSPDLLRALLVFIVNTYDVVDFHGLRQRPDGRTNRPLAVLSFDDGYKDFIEVAHPLLSEFGIRANLNVIPGCVESGEPPFNVALQDVIGKAPQSQVWDLLAVLMPKRPVDRSRPMDRVRLGHQVSSYVKGKASVEQLALRDMVESAFPRLLSTLATPMLDVDDLQLLSKSYEVGLHSYSHSTMSVESEDFFREDVRRCSEWSRTVLGQDSLIYAFPNGAYRPWQVEVLLNAGFQDILLVNEAFSTATSRVHSRFTFHATSISEVRFRASGALRV